MSNGLLILIYCIAIYGFCNMMAFGSGPFRIFEHIRNISNSISEHFGMLFSCMMCMPANCGWIISLLDWFFLKNVSITPFNIILAGTNLWWVALIADCCFTTGVVWLIHNFESFFESISEGTSNVQENENNDDIKILHD